VARRIRLEYHRSGKGVATYDEWLVLERPDTKVLLLDSFPGPDVVLRAQVVLATGAPVIWFVFPETWRDVGRFHDAQGALTGWYTNFRAPLRMDGDRWISTDLVLDLWQPVEGAAEWLDERELAEAARRGIMDRPTLQRLQNERTMVQLLVAQGAWPPPIARDIDLAQARALKEASAII
jgi:predicted RNA-binding protein associated with RNAse of E/G family